MIVEKKLTPEYLQNTLGVNSAPHGKKLKNYVESLTPLEAQHQGTWGKLRNQTSSQ